MRLGSIFLCAALLAACGDGGGSSSDGPPGGGSSDGPGATTDASADLIAARPYASHVPDGLVEGTPAPLVVVLHGYSASGALQARYFGMLDASDRYGFLLAYPDGTVDGFDKHFWNATDACCGFGAEVDDVAYLNAVIDDMSARHSVDAARIYLVGHSNGAFMSHRMACDAAPRIAAIAALAGTVWNDPTKCAPSEHVSVLQIHGDADLTIPYGGGANLGFEYPGAEATVDFWAGKNTCGGALAPSGADFDLDSNVIGAETSPFGRTPCPADGDVALWRIRGGSHLPGLGQSFSDAVIPWLFAHPKS